MQQADSPYRTPSAPLSEHAGSSRSGVASAIGFLVLPLLGGAFGFGGYVASASFLESLRDPANLVLSYGQQAMFFSLPLCTLIGSGMGFSVAFLINRTPLVSATLLLAVSLVGLATVASVWRAQITSYGRDPSEAVLYWPPMAISLAAAALAIAVGVVWGMRRRGRLAVATSGSQPV